MWRVRVLVVARALKSAGCSLCLAPERLGDGEKMLDFIEATGEKNCALILNAPACASLREWDGAAHRCATPRKTLQTEFSTVAADSALVLSDGAPADSANDVTLQTNCKPRVMALAAEVLDRRGE